MQPNDQFQDILPTPTEDDIFFMRDELDELNLLIKRNERVVIAGGPVIAWWGFTGFAAGLWNFLWGLHLVPTIPVDPINAVAGYAGMFAIVHIMGSAKVLKLEFKAISAVWTGICMAIPLLLLGFSYRHVDNMMLMSGIQAILFAIAIGVSAMGSQKRWLLYPTAGWVVSALIYFFVINSFWRPLFFSLDCLAFLVIPGVYLGIIYQRERP